MPQIIQVDHFSFETHGDDWRSLMFTNAGWYCLTLFTFVVVGSPILTACLPHLRVMAIYCDLLFNDIQPIVVGLLCPFKTVFWATTAIKVCERNLETYFQHNVRLLETQ